MIYNTHQGRVPINHCLMNNFYHIIGELLHVDYATTVAITACLYGIAPDMHFFLVFFAALLLLLLLLKMFCENESKKININKMICDLF